MMTLQMQQITEKLERGVQDVFSSGKYTEYLSTMSRFHRYSFRNSMLIFLQKPDATSVAGFSTWKSFERSVNKGEAGIQILAPAPFKKQIEVDRDEHGNKLPQPVAKEITISAFKPVYVFDISQTSGKELPTLVQKLTAELEGYDNLLECLRDISPVPIEIKAIEGTANGYCTKDCIVIREGLSEQHTIKTAIHELAHAMLNHLGGDIARDTAEVQAESVAYITCQHLGIDSSQYTFGYVAGWSRDKELKELQASLEAIQKASTDILCSIDDKLGKVQQRDITAKQSPQKKLKDAKKISTARAAKPRDVATERKPRANKRS